MRRWATSFIDALNNYILRILIPRLLVGMHTDICKLYITLRFLEDKANSMHISHANFEIWYWNASVFLARPLLVQGLG